MSMEQMWTVWCDSEQKDGRQCCEMDQVSGSKRRAGDEFKKSGWKQTRKGWLCPQCAKEKTK
jgi:hypothetical protein